MCFLRLIACLDGPGRTNSNHMFRILLIDDSISVRSFQSVLSMKESFQRYIRLPAQGDLDKQKIDSKLRGYDGSTTIQDLMAHLPRWS